MSWLNDMTHAVRRECRRAERKWKKDKLQVSIQMFRDCWRHYQKTVKGAKRKKISDIILLNCHKPCVLFNTIDSLLNAPQTACIKAAPAVWENFLYFFIDKVTLIRAQISPSAYDPPISVPGSAVFDQFESVTLSFLQEIVGHLKPSGLLSLLSLLGYLNRFSPL